MVAAAGHGDGRVDDAVDLPHRVLHLARFDPEPVELHLVVGPADELQLAVHRPAGQVAGVVHAGSVGGERVGDEASGGDSGAAQVAEGQLAARHVDGADPARRHRPQPVVEHMDAQTGDRPADGAGVAAPGEVLVRQDPVGDVDGGLGDAVHVDQLGCGRPVPFHPAAQPHGVERLAAEDDAAQRRDGPLGVQVGLHEPVEGGRGLVEDGHPALPDQPVEVDR
ncbi:hypothetical protein SCALM49S_08388 [Streptomyces californicus]